MLSFRGTLEALQGIAYAGSDGFRAKCFEKPTPPAWWEDEVSAILDAAGVCIDGIARDVWLLLQSEWEDNMQVELVSFGIDRFDLEREVPGAAQDSSAEGDGLACGGWTFWLNTFCLDIGPLGIAFPLYEVRPDYLDWRRDDGDGTDCQSHSRFLLSMRSLQLFGPGWINPEYDATDASGLTSYDRMAPFRGIWLPRGLRVQPNDALA